MNKTVKILFVIFNIALFATNFMLVDFFPKGLLFGWMPGQLAFFIGSMIAASIVWGLYFNTFYNSQEHVDKRYKEREREGKA